MKKSLSLDGLLAAVPVETARLVSGIARVAAARETTIYLVGGPVRDLLLGRELVDVDLVVEGDARALAEAVLADSEVDGLELVPHDR